MTGRVLVVDDDCQVCRALSRVFAAAGFRVATARDAASALQQIDSQRGIGAIIAGRGLGSGPDGVRLLEEVQRRTPWIARILLSSSLDAGQIASIEGAGIALRCFDKPWDQAALLAAVRSVCLEQ